MKSLRKFAAALTTLSLAASMASCSAPTIGSGSANAVKIDGYDVKSGIFIFYTMQSYDDAKSQLAEETGSTPTLEDVKKAELDGVKTEKWIQDKATQYCSDYVAIQREFDKIGGELTAEEKDQIDTMVKNVVSNDANYHYVENGVGEDSIREMASISYKSNYIFNYYYGTEGEKGMSEDELKEYFDNNFARVKYVKLSYLDAEDNVLDESGKKKIRDMADKYAKQVNAKSSTEQKLFAMNDVLDDYNEYVESLTPVEEEEAAETTTTAVETTAETTTTTTTTDPHQNERLVQKPTTTTTDENAEKPAETTTLSESEKSTLKLNNYIFDDLKEYNKAVVLDDEENNAIYVVIRADLKERLNEDDLWVEDNISYLQSLNFNEEFEDYMKSISDAYSIERNSSAYRRYKPFDDIILE